MKYSVMVKTGVLDGASTDDDVYIRLNGEKGMIDFVSLDNSGNNSEFGQLDNFVISGDDVGRIPSIDIKCGGSWYFEYVVVAPLPDAGVTLPEGADPGYDAQGKQAEERLKDAWWLNDKWTLNELKSFLTEAGMKATVYPYHDWSNRNKDTHTIYAEGYLRQLQSSPEGTLTAVTYCVNVEIVDNRKSPKDSEQTVEMSAQKGLTKTTGSSSQQSWKVSNTTSVNGSFEGIGASTSFSAEFSQLKSRLQSSVNSAIASAKTNITTTAPAHQFTVSILEWMANEQREKVQYGFTTQTLTYPVSFTTGYQANFSGATPEEVLASANSKYHGVVAQRLRDEGYL